MYFVLVKNDTVDSVFYRWNY